MTGYNILMTGRVREVAKDFDRKIVMETILWFIETKRWPGEKGTTQVLQSQETENGTKWLMQANLIKMLQSLAKFLVLHCFQIQNLLTEEVPMSLRRNIKQYYSKYNH